MFARERKNRLLFTMTRLLVGSQYKWDHTTNTSFRQKKNHQIGSSSKNIKVIDTKKKIVELKTSTFL